MKALLIFVVAALLVPACRQKEKESTVDLMKGDCITVLKKAASCPDFWVRVHAVEFLADLGRTEEAASIIEDSLSDYAAVPQKRIGLWRSRYRIESDSAAKKQWLELIRTAYANPAGPDRIHAAETLSKLGYSLQHFDRSLVETDLANGGALSAYVHWGAALPLDSGDAFDFDLLWRALTSDDVSFRQTAAYAITFLDSIPLTRWNSLSKIALAEPENSEARPYLLGAAYALSPQQDSEAGVIKTGLLSYQSRESKSGRIELCRALARKPDAADLQVLSSLMTMKSPLRELPALDGVSPDSHPWNLDVQAAAAYSILKIYAK